MIEKKLQMLGAFHKGMDRYNARGFGGAKKLFTQVLAIIPEDRATPLLLEKATFY